MRDGGISMSGQYFVGMGCNSHRNVLRSPSLTNFSSKCLVQIPIFFVICNDFWLQNRIHSGRRFVGFDSSGNPMTVPGFDIVVTPFSRFL